MTSIVPLKRAASIRVSNVDKKTVTGDVPVRLCNYTDVYYRQVISSDQDFMAATASREQLASFSLHPGDVVITKDSETSDDIGVSAYVAESAPDLVCGYHLAIVRPVRNLIDGKFLYWSMASTKVREQLAVAATGVTRFGLRTDSISGCTIRLPELQQQRVIANFLDNETARIDALIGKKRRLQQLIAERWRAYVDRATSSGEEVPVRRITSLITSGPRGWAERAGEAGLPFIRSANLRPSSIDLRVDNLVKVDVPETSEARRSRVEVGDTVIGITGANTGWVGYVTPDHVGGYVSQHVAILRARDVEQRWLSYSLFSRRTQEQLLAGQYGGTKQQLGLEDLADLRIFCPSDSEQRQVCAELDQAASRTTSLGVGFDRQIALLQEHRQALITAAVTGELHIPGIAA